MVPGQVDPQLFDTLVDMLLEHGFEPPFYFAAIAINGSMILGSYKPIEGSDDLDCEFIAWHCPDGSFTAPLNIMFVDRNGEAARAVLHPSGEPEIIH